MTRYIDADALREALGITGTADTCNGCKYNDRYQYCNTDNASRFSYVCECIDDAPTVDAVPIQYILTTIRKWNRDGYAESAEALEILVMNWDKEKTEWSEREDE